MTVFSTTPYRGWLGYALNLTKGSGFDWRDEEDSHDVSGRVAIAPPGAGGVLIVVSGARGRQDGGARTLAGLGLDYAAGAWHLMAEGLHEQRAESRRVGYVTLAAYRFGPRARPEDPGPFELAARLAAVHRLGPAPIAAVTPELEIEDVLPWLSPLREAQVGVNYYFTPEIRLMGNVVTPLDERGAGNSTMLVRWQVLF